MTRLELTSKHQANGSRFRDFLNRTWRNYSWRREMWGVVFVLPAVICLAVFSLLPVTQAFYLSFFKFDLFTPLQFVGLDNYRYLWESDIFHNSFFVTVLYVFGTCIPIWFISFGLAMLFNKNFKFRDLFLTLYFAPVVMSLIVASMIWKSMYNPSGPINELFALNIPWLTNDKTVMPALIIMSIWKGVGYYMILYLAGLRNIPTEYYEASSLDGANWWDNLRYITLPLMQPTILFVVVISIIIGFKVFSPMFIMTLGGPNNASQVLTLNIYETAFNFSRMGRAAAESVFMFFILMGFSIVQLRLFRTQR
jgi:multiple sugar transport system permease protein